MSIIYLNFILILLFLFKKYMLGEIFLKKYFLINLDKSRQN